MIYTGLRTTKHIKTLCVGVLGRSWALLGGSSMKLMWPFNAFKIAWQRCGGDVAVVQSLEASGTASQHSQVEFRVI